MTIERGLRHVNTGAITLHASSEDQPFEAPPGWVEVPVAEAHAAHAIGVANVHTEVAATLAEHVAEGQRRADAAIAARLDAAERIAAKLDVDVADVLAMFQNGAPA